MADADTGVAANTLPVTPELLESVFDCLDIVVYRYDSTVAVECNFCNTEFGDETSWVRPAVHHVLAHHKEKLDA